MSDPDLINIGTWSRPLRLIVILTLCLLLIGITYVALLQTQQQQLTQFQNTRQHLQATFEQQHARTTQLPHQQARYIGLRNALDQQVQPDTAPASTADLLIAVSQIGLSTDINFTTFQPQPSVTHDLYTETPIILGVTGHYHSLATFISNLSRHPGIMTLHNMVLQRTTPVSKKNQPLSLTCTLKAYQTTDRETPPTEHRPSTSPALPEISPIIYAEAGRRDPFKPQQHKPTVSTKQTPLPHPQGVLQQYALSTLQMVGTISQQQQLWGLLQDPDGRIHQVKTGSYVGQHQGRIQAIHPDSIIVHEPRDTDKKIHHITLRQTAPPKTGTVPKP